MCKHFNTLVPSDLYYNSNVGAGTRHRALSAKFKQTQKSPELRESPVIRVYFTFPLHMQTHVHSQQIDDTVTCVLRPHPALHHWRIAPSGYNGGMTEDVRSYACDLSGRNTWESQMSSCSPILPHGYLLASGDNYMLMFATSDSSVLILIGGVFSASRCAWHLQETRATPL